MNQNQRMMIKMFDGMGDAIDGLLKCMVIIIVTLVTFIVSYFVIRGQIL